ncbi:TonB-dependent receptor family protein [Pedobacter sp. AW31-3R]|uniref:TonB-dependent receptor family protein n=1 Tax=Pedobacter sp. AW31-3R TaxID=3445781 RepID=UPI003FA01440
MKNRLTLFLLSFSLLAYGQAKQDTSKKLKEVVIKPYFSPQSLLRATGAVDIIDATALEKQLPQSFVAAMNTIAGLRMEERSPGSYRLSIRGSLLRSPFGIRNVKIYFDDFPLTDAGGNSYLNALDVAAAGSIQILKGPQSSLYGANSGGVILINSPQTGTTSPNSVALNVTGGSFGLFRQHLSLGKTWKKYRFNLTQAYQRSNGYRDHSGMERKYIQLSQQWDYSRSSNLKALFFYSDLHYETPGGLTAAQYALNPAWSRPAAGEIRSAVEQQAGIYSKTGFAGISNTWNINSNFKQVTAVFGSYTDFKNPFITNYEHRKEFTLGIRTYVSYEKKTTDVNWQFNLGLEGAGTHTDFSNRGNNFGEAGTLTAADQLHAATNFAFAHLHADLKEKLFIELSASANLYRYSYESTYPEIIAEKTNSFNTQIMPRLALSYLLVPEVSLRGSVSRGYSPPTLSEIRASDNIINVDLQPENGWNYETGLKYQAAGQRFILDVTGFYYRLKNAIVRRANENDTDYFINAGGTKQWGLETSLSGTIITPNQSHFIQGLQLSSAYTLSRFTFDDYFDRSVNLSGKSLTGVPKNMITSSISVQLSEHFNLFLQHTYSSRIPLTDANTVYANEYHLMQGRIGWKSLSIAGIPLEIFAGADNIFDSKYSLGNDLNAAGGRYLNAAATRNFYGGLTVNFQK